MSNRTPEREAALRAQFDSFDLHHENELTFQTLGQVASQEGTFLDRLLATVLLRTYDDDKNGRINLEEFAKFCDDVDASSETHLLLRIFRIADRDHSGKLEVGEVEDIANQMGMRLTREQARQEIIALDRDGDHKLDFSEFCQLLGSAAGPQ
jgi:Ca2+-binding EF-hand superfamily protein